MPWISPSIPLFLIICQLKQGLLSVNDFLLVFRKSWIVDIVGETRNDMYFFFFYLKRFFFFPLFFRKGAISNILQYFRGRLSIKDIHTSWGRRGQSVKGRHADWGREGVVTQKWTFALTFALCISFEIYS